MRSRSKIAYIATEFSELAVYRFGISEAFALAFALVIRLALFCDFAVKRLRVGRFADVPDSGRLCAGLQHRGQQPVGRMVAVHEGLDVDDDLLAHVDAALDRRRSHMRQKRDLTGVG